MAATHKEVGKKYCKYHPLRPCTECLLCGKSCPYFSHYGGWSEKEQDFLKMHWGENVEPQSCICVAHQKEAKRSHPPGYTPKWSKKQLPEPEGMKAHCAYPSCTSTSKLITPSFAPASDLLDIIKCDENKPLLLCSKHYQELYRQITSLPCASCNIKPKPGTYFTRHCPDPALVNEALYGDSSMEEGECLTSSDSICLSCYKSHLEIIRSHTDQYTLIDMIEIWKVALPDLTDPLRKAILKVVLHTAREFQNQRAVLLPKISQLFLKEYLSETDECSEDQEHTIESKDGTMKFTTRWLLKQLKVYLHPFMNSKCIHKKFGTLLYSKEGDLLTSLSWALGSTSSVSEVLYQPNQSQIPSVERTLGEAGDVLNDILHSEINRLSQSNLVQKVEQFNIDEEVASIDPLLWVFLESVTRTVKQRSGGQEENVHVKKLRRYYIYCLLAYTANTQKPTPLHTLLTDTVEMCGGSEKLVKVLNQFGVVSSSDTHDRLVTDVTEMQRLKTIWDVLIRNTLTVSSVDNYDQLQSHASVYCGDQSRGYHGTTLQLVQPNPSKPITPGETSQTSGKRQLDSSVQPNPSKPITAGETAQTSGKRQLDSSPANSPHKLGKEGPKRQRTLKPRTLKPRSLAEQLQVAKAHNLAGTENTAPALIEAQPTLQSFKELPCEKVLRKSLESKLWAYTFLKQQLSAGSDHKVLLEFKDLYAYSTQGSIDISNIHYMELVDENPDSNDTMKHVAELLISTADATFQGGYVILTGDGKTYQHLMEIKQTYGMALNKLLIFPGDWHTLFNFQPVLIKIYYHAGLKELAQASGFKGETLTSLEQCSNFKRTHHFLLQAWQALYRAMLAAFKATSNCDFEVTIDEDTNIRSILNTTETLLSDKGIDNSFRSFLSEMSDRDDTWLFWYRFVFRDCFAYIRLFLAIRCQNWDLRISALKSMTPLFTAYDRTTYQRLIPYHLADLQKFPPFILEQLAQCFAVSITGGKGHAVAIDEAHEMCINKDMKMAITHPTKSYLQKMSLFLRYRISAHKNLLCQVFPRLRQEPTVLFDIFSATPELKEREENIMAMLSIILEKSLLPTSVSSNRGLVNAFSSITANPQQNFDLMNFFEIGTQNLQNFINYRLLKIPSTTAPVRQHRLLTMATPKISKRSINQKEKEMKQVNKCLRLRLAWCNRTGQSYDPTSEQYSLYPRAIADEYGCPMKGSKSAWTNKLKQRYKEQVVIDQLPSQWTPDATIIDGMFIINCKPLRTSKTIAEYSLFLFRRFLLPHFQDQVNEVHLLFDTPNGNLFNPKKFEQKRRDKSKDIAAHKHEAFTPASKVPTNWRSYIDCRQCKRSLIEAIGLAFYQSVRFQLRYGQTLYLSGCFPSAGYSCTYQLKGHNITGTHPLPTPAPHYKSNCDEADTRIWRHIAQTSARRILVYSPDTDIYNIGLALLSRLPNKDVIVQLNVFHSLTTSYLHLNGLVNAMELDPDLGGLDQQQLPNTMQMLFIVSGCDYISYFAGYGKAAFFNTFYQHAAFITGNQARGHLSDISEDQKKEGFLAFLRLIGTMYFKKYYAAVASLEGVQTPQQLLHAQEASPDATSDTEKTHLLWYSRIRAIVSDRITEEKERMPSHTSMWRHWLRSCWVARMWANSSEEDVQGSLPSPEACGWKKNVDSSYDFDWESPDVEEKVQDTINFLTKGCSCKKGCRSKRCSCRKRGHFCGPGCQCQNCENAADVVGRDQESGSGSVGDASSSENGMAGHSTTSDDREDGTAIDEMEQDMDESNTDSDTDGNTEGSTEGSSSESESEKLETEIISELYDDLNNYSIAF